MCENCGHVQILHVINPDYLWDTYHFKTSRNNIIIYIDDLEEFKNKRKKRIWEELISNKNE